MTDMAATFEEVVYDKLVLFEYIPVAAVDDGDVRALVDDVCNKAVVESHGGNTALGTRATCDGMTCRLKQNLLLEHCSYVQ